MNVAPRHYGEQSPDRGEDRERVRTDIVFLSFAEKENKEMGW